MPACSTPVQFKLCSGFTLDTHTTNIAYLDGLLGTIASRED